MSSSGFSFAQAGYRRMLAADIAVLSEALPPLLSGDWSQGALRELLTSSHQLRVLQLHGADTVVGFAEFATVADECQLYSIAVFSPWQRQGLGRHLLQVVLDEAKATGSVGCNLEVRESNAAARKLYESLGFVVDGIRKQYYSPQFPTGSREDAVLYSCSF